MRFILAWKLPEFCTTSRFYPLQESSLESSFKVHHKVTFSAVKHRIHRSDWHDSERRGHHSIHTAQNLKFCLHAQVFSCKFWSNKSGIVMPVITLFLKKIEILPLSMKLPDSRLLIICLNKLFFFFLQLPLRTITWEYFADKCVGF